MYAVVLFQQLISQFIFHTMPSMCIFFCSRNGECSVTLSIDVFNQNDQNWHLYVVETVQLRSDTTEIHCIEAIQRSDTTSLTTNEHRTHR